jgi:hypothetical protein
MATLPEHLELLNGGLQITEGNLSGEEMKFGKGLKIVDPVPSF